MALKVACLLGACSLIFAILITQPLQIQSIDPQPSGHAFDFLKHLQGAHRGQTIKGLSTLKQYIKNFGYVTDFSNQTTTNFQNHANNDFFDDCLESVIKTYQTFFNLKPTGDLDCATLADMQVPRCGVADTINGKTATHGRLLVHMHTVSHYTFFGPYAPRPLPTENKYITCAFRSQKEVPQHKLRTVVGHAFRIWSSVTGFEFWEGLPRRADVEIGFHSGWHGHSTSFDGRGGILAHGKAIPR